MVDATPNGATGFNREVCSKSSGGDGVVRGIRFTPRKKGQGLGFEDCDMVVRASEAFYGFERFKEIDNQKFGFAVGIVTKDIPALVAFDLVEARKYLRDQELLVRVGVCRGGPSAPMTSNHFLFLVSIG